MGLFVSEVDAMLRELSFSSFIFFFRFICLKAFLGSYTVLLVAFPEDRMGVDVLVPPHRIFAEAVLVELKR